MKYSCNISNFLFDVCGELHFKVAQEYNGVHEPEEFRFL